MPAPDRGIAYRFGRFVLDTGRGALLSAGHERPIRPRSFALLHFMVEHAGQLVPREMIMQALWPNTFVVDDSISQCVHDIRRALDPDGARLLRTIHRRGYVFTAKVGIEPLAAGAASPDPRTRRCDVTAVLTDLQGYTHLAETLQPALFAALLDEYLSGMIDTVTRHGGKVLRINGDGISILFGGENGSRNHAERALDCTLALDSYAAGFRIRWRARGVEVGITRIGVNSGPALIGGFGIGRSGDFTAHGETINLASRLEEANRQLGTRICVSPSVIERAPDFRAHLGGAIALHDGGAAPYQPRVPAKVMETNS